MSTKNIFQFIAALLLVYVLIKCSVFHNPGKFDHGVVAFSFNIVYSYLPLLSFLISCYVLFMPRVRTVTLRLLLFFLFYVFPARRVVMDNDSDNGLYFMKSYFYDWNFCSNDFRLEYLIAFVIATIIFVRFIISRRNFSKE